MKNKYAYLAYLESAYYYFKLPHLGQQTGCFDSHIYCATADINE